MYSNTTKLDPQVKETTIQWLENMQSNGFFDGIEEAFTDFNKCTEDEIVYYFTEWYAEDHDLDADFDSKDIIVTEYNRLNNKEILGVN